MSKEDVKGDNSCGITGVVLGILSILLASAPGSILGVVGLVFSLKQKKVKANKWSRAGFVLNIVGIVLGIIVTVVILTKLQSVLMGSVGGATG